MPEEVQESITYDYLSTITMPSGEICKLKDVDLRDEFNSRAKVYYVEGPLTDITEGVWTGTISGLTGYYNGLTIIYVPAVAGATGTTLSLNGYAATPCYTNNTTGVTTHYSVGTPILFTYSDGAWRRADYNKDTTYSTFANLVHTNGSFIANSAVYRYKLLFHVSEDNLTPLNNNNNVTKTTKTILINVEFEPFSEILYYATTTAISSGAVFPATALAYAHSAVDLRHTFNINDTVDPLTAGSDVYMKVSPQINGKVKIASAMPLTQTLPSTQNDIGYWYIYLGRAYSAYQISLYPYHPVYYYDGTSVRLKQNPKYGAVIGPHSSVSDHIATFSGTTGALIKDSGYPAATSLNRYGVCYSGSANAEKIVTLTDGVISDEEGTRITVLFMNKNTVSFPYMVVTDAYGNSVSGTIYNNSFPLYAQTALSGYNDFIYDGNCWNIVNRRIDYFDIVLSNQSVSSSTTNITYQKSTAAAGAGSLLYAVITRAWPQSNWDYGAIVSIVQQSDDANNIYLVLSTTSSQVYDINIRVFYESQYSPSAASGTST